MKEHHFQVAVRNVTEPWMGIEPFRDDRVDADVFPTLQGTGIKTSFKEQLAYIVIRWLTIEGSRPIYRTGAFFARWQ